jgi:hypothetical protein
MNEQPDLLGLAIHMPDACPRCRGRNAAIGAGIDGHRASALCACRKHRGWMSDATFDFIATCVEKFGAPTKSIIVTRAPAEKANGIRAQN